MIYGQDTIWSDNIVQQSILFSMFNVHIRVAGDIGFFTRNELITNFIYNMYC